jgi:uncharacterized protein YciI
MLYLIVSTPHPTRPNDVKEERLKFRQWIDDLKSSNKLICFYPKVGRGSVVILDVSSNEELHELMNQWANIVPAEFNIHPLVEPLKAEKLLK